MAFRGHIIVIRPSTWTLRHSSLFHSRTHSQGCTTTTQQCRSAQTTPLKCVFLSLPAHTITIIYQETIKKYKFIRKLQRIRYVSALALPQPQENSQNESEKKYSNTIPHSTITIFMISPSIAINIILLGCLFTIIKPFLIPCSPVLPVSSEGCLLHWEKVMAHRIGMLYLAWPDLAGSNQSSLRRRDD